MVDLSVKRKCMSKDPAAVFVRNDWIAFGLGAFLPFIVYCWTLAPTITLEHAGSLVVAGEFAGIGRVPGYPVWHMMAYLFTHVFSFVTYHGQPNPAWATNFMSAVFGGLSCGLIALMVSWLGRLRWHDQVQGAVSAVLGVVAATMTGLGHCIWSQAVITETHTLTLFFFLLILLMLLRWPLHGTSRYGLWVALLFGIGFCQSQFILLLAPTLLLVTFVVSRRLGVAFCIAWAFALFVPLAYYRSETHSTYQWLGFIASLVLGVLGACRVSKSGFGMFAIIVSAVVLLHLYLPIASAMNPPMNWGYPQTWEGFWHVVTRGQYEKLSPINPFTASERFGHQLVWYWDLLRKQYAVPLLMLSLSGLLAFRGLRGSARWAVPVLLMTFVMHTVVVIICTNPKMDLQDSFFMRCRFIHSIAVVGICIGLGMCDLCAGISKLQGRWSKCRFAD